MTMKSLVMDRIVNSCITNSPVKDKNCNNQLKVITYTDKDDSDIDFIDQDFHMMKDKHDENHKISENYEGKKHLENENTGEDKVEMSGKETLQETVEEKVNEPEESDKEAEKLDQRENNEILRTRSFSEIVCKDPRLPECVDVEDSVSLSPLRRCVSCSLTCLRYNQNYWLASEHDSQSDGSISAGYSKPVDSGVFRCLVSIAGVCFIVLLVVFLTVVALVPPHSQRYQRSEEGDNVSQHYMLDRQFSNVSTKFKAPATDLQILRQKQISQRVLKKNKDYHENRY